MKLELFQNKIKNSIEIYYQQMSPLIEQVLQVVTDYQRPATLLGVDDDGLQCVLSPESIVYFESVDKKSYAYTHHKVYGVEGNLNDLEDGFNLQGFVRINKSHLVNIYHIEGIKPEVNMRIKALVTSGEYLFINRSYKKNFEHFLKEKRAML